MPDLTIVIPHKRNPGNDDALAICLDCLARNTVSDFKLIMDYAADKPLYARINRMVKQVDTEVWCYLASDMFVAPRWDTPMLDLWTPDTIVNPIVVEPGAIYPYEFNLLNDFGRKPQTFRRVDFEAWTEVAPMISGEGWFAGYMMSTQAFLEAGCFSLDLTPDDQGFSAADWKFFNEWKASGKHVVRARSYVYHLQRWSELSEQTKDNRG